MGFVLFLRPGVAMYLWLVWNYVCQAGLELTNVAQAGTELLGILLPLPLGC